MLREQPMVECMYGWRRVLRLYQDYLDLNGRCYALNELVYTNPVYRRMLGISSIRLELHFRNEVVVLRGMVAVEKVQAIVRYLNSRCVTAPSSPLRLGSGQAPQKESSRFRSAGMPVPSHASPWGPVDTGCDVGQQQFVDAYVVPLAAQKTQEQLEQRLRSLRAERSQREKGFDVEKPGQNFQQFRQTSINNEEIVPQAVPRRGRFAPLLKRKDKNAQMGDEDETLVLKASPSARKRLFERKEKSSAQQGKGEPVEAEVAEDLEDCMKWSYHMAWRIERGEVYD
ncbi:MAG TPA: hypothetical protein VFB12_18965 [Ktedonobacteraceae bacterium]|nr:hypothetical protein [Ktedonobacteraceae bacterium]